MSAEYRLSYTASEIDKRLGRIPSLVSSVNGIGPDENGNVQINVISSDGEDDLEVSKYNNLYSFSDAYVAWCNGDSFPIAFYGDSTFYGTNISQSGKPFCDILQRMLREECGSGATIYKVAESGDTLDDGINEFDSKFGTNGTYSDAKMVGIGYGINDRLNYTTFIEYKNAVYNKVETLIKKCFDRGIQPFLVTSQATIECGVATGYANSYPLRDANSMNVCANGAKKELAKKYNIPLIDLNSATESFLINSEQTVDTIISDRLHFGDVGHSFEAGFLFSQIVPRVICVNKKDEAIISYARQHLRNTVPEDKLSFGGRLKLYANYSRTSTNDVKIFDAYVYVRDHKSTIFAYRSAVDTTSYVKVDGVKHTLTSQGTSLGDIDVGLHHLEAYSGNGKTVDFTGFVINDSSPSAPTLLVDSMSLSLDETAFTKMDDTIVPTVLMFGANSTKTHTVLSGKEIHSIGLNISPGTISIGKVQLSQYGTGELTMISPKSYTIQTGGYTIIDLGGLFIGDTEALAFGMVGDTAVPCYIKAGNFSGSGSDAYICTSEVFKDGLEYSIGMKCRIYGK